MVSRNAPDAEGGFQILKSPHRFAAFGNRSIHQIPAEGDKIRIKGIDLNGKISHLFRGKGMVDMQVGDVGDLHTVCPIGQLRVFNGVRGHNRGSRPQNKSGSAEEQCGADDPQIDKVPESLIFPPLEKAQHLTCAQQRRNEIKSAVEQGACHNDPLRQSRSKVVSADDTEYLELEGSCEQGQRQQHFDIPFDLQRQDHAPDNKGTETYRQKQHLHFNRTPLFFLLNISHEKALCNLFKAQKEEELLKFPQNAYIFCTMQANHN